MRVLIAGCGYVGMAAGAELARRGHEVFGLRRGAEGAGQLKEAGIELLAADITRRAELDRLPRSFDWVVDTVSSTGGSVEDYRQVYLNGMRNLIDWLAPAPPKKFVYTSSTSVYGQQDGEWVDETSATEPASATGHVLRETEQVLLKAGGIALRVAGIYGPERGYWLRQYLRGEAVMTGDGQRILNMIHRDDVAGGIIAALQNGRPRSIYNAADDEPVAQIDLFRWLSTTLGREMPPLATGADEAASRRGVTNKKVSNRKLKEELGYRFKYPTFREGFAAEMKRLGAA